MNMVISIREATIDDFDTVYQFICELQNKAFDREEMNKLYIQNIAQKDNIYLIAQDANVSIGYLSCHLQTLLHHGGKVAEIQEMYVQPTHRSKGVGKKLMGEVKILSKEKGASQLEVTTRIIREKAIQFYIRESFKDSHKKLVYYF